LKRLLKRPWLWLELLLWLRLKRLLKRLLKRPWLELLPWLRLKRLLERLLERLWLCLKRPWLLLELLLWLLSPKRLRRSQRSRYRYLLTKCHSRNSAGLIDIVTLILLLFFRLYVLLLLAILSFVIHRNIVYALVVISTETSNSATEHPGHFIEQKLIII
jgi:hypothetical protein